VDGVCAGNQGFVSHSPNDTLRSVARFRRKSRTESVSPPRLGFQVHGHLLVLERQLHRRELHGPRFPVGQLVAGTLGDVAFRGSMPTNVTLFTCVAPTPRLSR